MSTILLYHGFGIRGYQYQRTTYAEGTVKFTLRQERNSLKCSDCGSEHVQRRGQVTRVWHHLPIGRRAVFLELSVARVHCPKCELIRQVKVPFAQTQRSDTKAFARYVPDLRRSMTIADISRHLGVGWGIIKDIEKRYLVTHFAKPKLKHLRKIAIDEISVGKGHRYLTVVLDRESGAVVHVGDGKGADALRPFWKRLKAAHARIEAVATDMSPAYIKAVCENLPDATIGVREHAPAESAFCKSCQHTSRASKRTLGLVHASNLNRTSRRNQ